MRFIPCNPAVSSVTASQAQCCPQQHRHTTANGTSLNQSNAVLMDSSERFLSAPLARQRHKRLRKTPETHIISLSERRTWGHVISCQRLPAAPGAVSASCSQRASSGDSASPSSHPGCCLSSTEPAQVNTYCSGDRISF